MIQNLLLHGLDSLFSPYGDRELRYIPLRHVVELALFIKRKL
jgi:hypothetical protein